MNRVALEFLQLIHRRPNIMEHKNEPTNQSSELVCWRLFQAYILYSQQDLLAHTEGLLTSPLVILDLLPLPCLIEIVYHSQIHIWHTPNKYLHTFNNYFSKS